jgi:hypothetical protein
LFFHNKQLQSADHVIYSKNKLIILKLALGFRESTHWYACVLARCVFKFGFKIRLETYLINEYLLIINIVIVIVIFSKLIILIKLKNIKMYTI